MIDAQTEATTLQKTFNGIGYVNKQIGESGVGSDKKVQSDE